MKKAHEFNILNNLTEEECHIGCMNEATKLDDINEATSAVLVNICEINCILENTEYVPAKSEGVKFEKRADCDHITDANISIEENFRNGYNRY